MPVKKEVQKLKKDVSLESLTSKLNKINIKNVEKLEKNHLKKSTDTVEKVENEHEKIIMNPEVEIIKPEVTIIEPEISSSPDIEKQSVKKIHAMFKNGPFALPMLTPESIKNLPKSPTKTKTEELKTPDSDQG